MQVTILTASAARAAIKDAKVVYVSVEVGHEFRQVRISKAEAKAMLSGMNSADVVRYSVQPGIVILGRQSF